MTTAALSNAPLAGATLTSSGTTTLSNNAAALSGLMNMQTASSASPTGSGVVATSSALAATAPTANAAPAAPAATSTTAPATAPHATVVTVNSVASLNAALKVAASGETIALAAGNYSGVSLSNLHFSQAVTITSADPSHQAVLVGLGVGNSSGIAFSNLGMTTVGVTDPYYGFRVTGSQNISFSGVNVYGSSTATPGSQISGFYVTNSSGVSITNSNLHNMNAAIIDSNDQNINISNNTFSMLNKGGVEMVATSNVSINANTFTNFSLSAGTHSDGIQLYTQGATASAANISITNNVVTRGAGDAFQGIFVKDETGHLPYQNLTISNNEVVGGTWDSIYLSAGVTGTLNVSNNLVTSWAGLNIEGAGDAAAQLATTFATASFVGSITLDGDLSQANVVETGNVAQSYITNNAVVSAPAGNAQVGAIAPVTNLTDLQTMVTAVAAHAAVAASAGAAAHATVTGNVLVGDSGGSLYLADIGVGSGGQQVVASGGTSVTGAYGTLTINPDGSYSYVETKTGLVAGQIYDEHFTTTIANESGQATTSTLDVAVSGSAVGDGGLDHIIGGSGAQTFSGFGTGSIVVAGTGLDTVQFDTIAQSAPTAQTQIQNFQAGDIIDLSRVDPLFHFVTKLDGHADELVLQQITTTHWQVYGDTVGTGHVNFQFQITGAAGALIADSFHL